MKRQKENQQKMEKVKKEKKPFSLRKAFKKKEPKTSKGKKTDGTGFFAILTGFSVLPLILSVVIVSFVSLTIFKSNLESNVKNTLYVVAENLAEYCKMNEITAMNASSYYDYLDSLKEQGIEMAIIQEGIPATASIKNENDYRVREIPIKVEKVDSINGFYDKNIVIDNQEYYAYYLPIQGTGSSESIAFAAELKKDVNAVSSKIMISLTLTAAILMIFFLIVSVLFSNKLAKDFKIMSKNVNALSEGDLGVQAERRSQVKEMNMLLLETKKLQQNLAETIGKSKEVAGKLADDVTSVTALSNSSAGKASEVTSAMNELSAATVSISNYVEDIHGQVQEIDVCINDISGNVEHLYESSNKILVTNDEARTRMEDILSNSETSVKAVGEIQSQISQTNDSIAEIDKAVELIFNISSQTNLLSLNASIEAARAGEFGRGFSVVAEEIRRLSEQSAEGAEMIKNLAASIVQKSDKSVELANRVHESILEEQDNAIKTQKKYTELSEHINESVTEIRAIAEKKDSLTGYKEKIVGSVQGLKEISEDNTVKNEKVDQNIADIIAEIKLINDSCTSMKEMADKLEKSVAIFKLGEVEA